MMLCFWIDCSRGGMYIQDTSLHDVDINNGRNWVIIVFEDWLFYCTEAKNCRYFMRWFLGNHLLNEQSWCVCCCFSTVQINLKIKQFLFQNTISMIGWNNIYIITWHKKNCSCPVFETFNQDMSVHNASYLSYCRFMGTFEWAKYPSVLPKCPFDWLATLSLRQKWYSYACLMLFVLFWPRSHHSLQEKWIIGLNPLMETTVYRPYFPIILCLSELWKWIWN